MKRIRKKESDILIIIALVIYFVVKIVDKVIINIPDILYFTFMIISIGIILSALRSQKEGK